jgi:glycosyltransferase involved in cell wall biosynthesis
MYPFALSAYAVRLSRRLRRAWDRGTRLPSNVHSGHARRVWGPSNESVQRIPPSRPHFLLLLLLVPVLLLTLIGSIELPPFASVCPSDAGALENSVKWVSTLLWGPSLPFGGFACTSSLYPFTPESLFSAKPRLIILSTSAHTTSSTGHAHLDGEVVLELPVLLSVAHLRKLAAFLSSLRPALTAIALYGGSPPQLHSSAPTAWLRDLKVQIPELRIGVAYSIPDTDDEGVAVDILGVATATFMSSSASSIHLRDTADTVWPFQFAPLSMDDGHTQHVGILPLPSAGQGDNNHMLVRQLLETLCGFPLLIVHTTVSPVLENQVPPRCADHVRVHSDMTTAALQHFAAQMDAVILISTPPPPEGVRSTSLQSDSSFILSLLAAGVPCLVDSDHQRELLATDPFLSATLVVDITNLRTQLKVILQNRQEFSVRGKSVAQHADVLARASWGCFRARLLDDDVNVPLCSLPSSWPIPPSLSTPWMTVESNPAFHATLSPLRTKVAFLANELSPLTPGGAGVVVSALALELLTAGFSVTLLVSGVTDKQLAAWRSYALSAVGDAAASTSRLRLLRVEPFEVMCTTTTERNACGGAERSDPNWLTSVSFARATQAAYQEDPFDLLEVFDYTGIGYELLRARYSASISTSSLASVLDGFPSSLGHLSSGDEYLPNSVPIWVRLHGTYQLIDAHENENSEGMHHPFPQQRSLYAREHFVLETASAIVAQSSALAYYYAKAYALDPGRMLIGPPPMRRILSDFIQLGRPGQGNGFVAELAANPTEESIMLIADGCRRPQCQLVLILGKLQSIKGTEVVAEALGNILLLDSDNSRTRAVFLGHDVGCSSHSNAHMEECINRLLGSSAARESVNVLAEGVPRSSLPRIVRALDPVVAVMASSFETFSMAAHELFALGVPLVLSRIPAFTEYFARSSDSVRFFARGNSTDLAAVLGAVLRYPLSRPQHAVNEYPAATGVYQVGPCFLPHNRTLFLPLLARAAR